MIPERIPVTTVEKIARTMAGYCSPDEIHDAIANFYPGTKYIVNGADGDFFAFPVDEIEAWINEFLAEELAQRPKPLTLAKYMFIYRNKEKTND